MYLTEMHCIFYSNTNKGSRTYSVPNTKGIWPRFWVIKIIFLMIIIFIYTSNIQAEEFDFVFHVDESPLPKKTETNPSGFYHPVPSWRAEMQTSLLPSLLKGTGKLVFGGFGKISNRQFFEWDKYLLKLGSSGKRNAIGYGVNFYSIGKNFNGKINSQDKQKKGKTGYESWISWNIKELQLKSKFSELWVNKLNYDQWLRLETNYLLTSKPDVRFSLSYGLGKKNRFAHSPNNAQTNTDSLNSFKAQFRFVNDYLKFSTEINRLSLQNDLDDAKDFQKDTFYFNSTLLPQHVFSITSSYRYSENLKTSKENKRKLNTMESSLRVTYKLVEIPAQLKFSSAYNNYLSNDGFTNKDIIKFGAQFNWKLQERYSDVDANWSVDFQYKNTKDSINPASNNTNWSVNLLWSWSLT